MYITAEKKSNNNNEFEFHFITAVINNERMCAQQANFTVAHRGNTNLYIPVQIYIF